MKKLSLILCSLFSLAFLCSCGKPLDRNDGHGGGTADEVTQISLWTFPVGNWGNNTTVSGILNGFHKKHPNVHVSVEYLNYNTGDEKINEAAQNGELPDLVLEGPERLVTDWGVKGMMADISDLWQTETAQSIYPIVSNACKTEDGTYYEMPVCMTAHCMVINYEMFEKAGALQFLPTDENGEYTHTWTTQNFVDAVHAIENYGKTAGEIYCQNQSGDQGTRALITNLYGGSYTNAEHTGYTVDSPENIQALQLLYDLDGIEFTPESTSNDAISNFCDEKTAMCFCWSASLAIQQIINDNLKFKIIPMAFPTPDEQTEPKLQGGIWGFGVFDNGDEKRIEAAKTFIRYITENTTVYSKSVLTSSYWPVRQIFNASTEINIYENDEFMTEYGDLMQYMGDYYQVTSNWQEARTAWWNMLADVGKGVPVEEAIKDFPAKKSASS